LKPWTFDLGPRRMAVTTMVWTFCLTLLLAGFGVGWARPEPESSPTSGAQAEISRSASESAELQEVRLGTLPDYSRLAFSFDQPIESYNVRRGEVDELWFDFGPGRIKAEGRFSIEDRLVRGVAVRQESGRVLAKVKVKPTRFSFRHFTGQEGRIVILDLRSEDPITEEKPVEPLPGPKNPVLRAPDPKESARAVRASLPDRVKPGTDQALLAAAAEEMAQGDFQAAINHLETLKAAYPASPYLDPGLFLLAEAYFYLEPENLADHFVKITQICQEAMISFPASPYLPRAALLRALAYMRMGYLNETIGYLKLLTEEHPQSEYAVAARVYMGMIYVKIDKLDLAEAVFDSIEDLSPSGPLWLEAIYALGQAYFEKGLYSKANEVFKAVLKSDKQFYVEQPAILYYMGEGYFYLGRPDLARAYLYHAINLNPEHKSGDIIMARIGDAYKEEGRDEEAIKVYELTKKVYPGSQGALISELRLADFGAVRSFFEPDSVFLDMEGGVEAATARMYEKIVENYAKQDSPLIELARFKIGLSGYNQGDYPQSIEIFKEILAKQGQGDLVEETKVLLNRALLEQVRVLWLQKKPKELISLYETNQSWINDLTWPEIRHYLALAYLALDLPVEAAGLFEANKGLTEHEAERLFGLAQAYLRLNNFKEAVRTLVEFRESFPGHPRIPEALAAQARGEAAQGLNEQALRHLEEALAADPGLREDGKLQLLLGELYLEAGHLRKSVQAMEKALQAQVNKPGSREEIFLTHSRLGRAYADLGQKDQAVFFLEKALESRPQEPFPEAVFLIARTFKKLGLTERALEVCKILEETPDPFWRAVAVQEAKALQPDQELGKFLKSTEPGSP